jgi:phage-related protein
MATAATIATRLGWNSKDFDKGIANAKSKATGFQKHFGGVSSAMQSAGKVAFMGLVGGAGLAAAAVGGVGLAIGKLAVDATPIPGLQNAFEGLAGRAEMSGDALLKAMQEGSGGMVAARDLMQQANLAAALVSDEFAYGLPDAMGLVQKAAAATGQDMGFMMDSLVKGVGRASPMILDNLGIQVSLTEATDAYAAQLGKTTGELSKAEQQEAVRLLTMEKLNEKYGDMASVNDTAAAKIAQFKATIQDTKDQIGMAFLPTLSIFMKMFSEISQKVLPIVTGALEKLAPKIEVIADTLFIFVRNIMNGMSPLEAFRKVINEFFPPEVSEKIQGFIDKVINFVSTIRTALQPVMDWIANNVQLKDVLITVGILIASWLIPIIVTFIGTVVSAAAPIVAAFLGVMAVVVLLRKAWESNFLGIRDKTKVALDAVKQFVLNAVTNIKAWWNEHGDAILAKANEMWQAVVGVFEWFKEQFMIIFNAFKLAFQGDWEGFGETLRVAWDRAWKLLKDIVDKAWQAIKDVDWLGLGKDLVRGIAKGISAGASWAVDAIKTLAGNLWDAITGFFQSDSPSKLMMNLGQYLDEGLAKGIKKSAQLPMKEMYNLSKKLTPDAIAYSNPAIKNLEGRSGTTINKNYNLTLNTAASKDEAIMGFELLEAFAS